MGATIMCEAEFDGDPAYVRHYTIVGTIEQAIRRNRDRPEGIPGTILFDCGVLLPSANCTDVHKLRWHTPFGSFSGKIDAVAIVRRAMERNPDPEHLASVVEAIRDAVHPMCTA